MPADVLRWSPPAVWGPGASKLGPHRFRLAQASDDPADQGVTYRLQHATTRSLGTKGPLKLRAACDPAPCAVEVRILAPDEGVTHDAKWHEVTISDSEAEHAVPAPPEVAEVQLVRRRPARAREGPAARTLTVSSLGF